MIFRILYFLSAILAQKIWKKLIEVYFYETNIPDFIQIFWAKPDLKKYISKFQIDFRLGCINSANFWEHSSDVFFADLSIGTLRIVII